jgi:hypothetical protein
MENRNTITIRPVTPGSSFSNLMIQKSFDTKFNLPYDNISQVAITKP